jgi:hypothetical protein
VPELKAAYEKLPPDQRPIATQRPDYPHHDEASGFALSAGVGLDLRLNRAMALRVASLEIPLRFIADPYGRDN